MGSKLGDFLERRRLHVPVERLARREVGAAREAVVLPLRVRLPVLHEPVDLRELGGANVAHVRLGAHVLRVDVPLQVAALREGGSAEVTRKLHVLQVDRRHVRGEARLAAEALRAAVTLVGLLVGVHEQMGAEVVLAVGLVVAQLALVPRAVRSVDVLRLDVPLEQPFVAEALVAARALEHVVCTKTQTGTHARTLVLLLPILLVSDL